MNVHERTEKNEHGGETSLQNKRAYLRMSRSGLREVV